jgi:hypothetical protein
VGYKKSRRLNVGTFLGLSRRIEGGTIINQHKEKTLQAASLNSVYGLLRSLTEHDKSLGIPSVKESNELSTIRVNKVV